ncbi:MAG: ribonuclease R [Pseudomonadota bacterium]
MPKHSNLPSKAELLRFLQSQTGRVGKRDLAKAFNLKGADRIALKTMLRELQDEGAIEGGRKAFREPGDLPPVALLEATAPDEDGDLRARPATWSDDADSPTIIVAPTKSGDPTLGPGDRFLARMKKLDGEPYAYEARLLKKLGRGALRVLGIFQASPGGGARVVPVNKKSQEEFVVAHGGAGGAEPGDLVEIEVLRARRYGLREARVLDVLGDPSAPRAISLIAIHEQGIPVDFPDEAVVEAEAAEPVETLGARTDLRDLPLVTIDPADARDHDDAVFAHADEDPSNPGGWVVWVAIADVAAYVRSGGPLDRAARERGNSTYFPDRVVPMLPERLSGDLCSLHEHVDRPCLAVRMVLDADGAKRSHAFHRGLMRSAASLTYEQAQAAADGAPDEMTEPLLETVIQPLFAAYRAAAAARDRRNPLDLDLPERRVELNAEGQVAAIRFRDRFDAHRLIEEFMILANVAAAETLQQARRPLLYRIHEEPNPDKIEALAEILDSVGVSLPKGQVMTTRRLNEALRAARDTDHAELVNMAVLRAQTQAYYGTDPIGHFGLALRAYAHFTSPIRRYADLTIHRGLIAALKLGRDGPDAADLLNDLAAAGEHISMTERRSMLAERDTIDRYLAAYLADRAGAQFQGRISGVQKFGLFVKLDETGADGLVPISQLGDEYFHFDEDAAQLIGERSGVTLRMGDAVTVRLLEATPETGGLIFELLDLPRARARRAGARGARAVPSKNRTGKSGSGKPAAGKSAAGKTGRGKVAAGRAAKAKAARRSKRRER